MTQEHNRDGRASGQTPGRGLDKREIRLLHTSDVHIRNDEHRDWALHGLQGVVDLAVGLGVDALLIAGDLFDRDGLERTLVAHVFRVLGAIGVPVVVLPGNHDVLLLDDAFDVTAIPVSVRLITHPDGELIALPGIGTSIWGKPVYDHSPAFLPLSGVPPRPRTGWDVVMGHGLVVPHGNPEVRSAPLFPDALANVEADYVALGHVHVFRDVTVGDTRICYSGAPSGMSSPGAALVTLSPGVGVRVDKVPVPPLKD